MPDYEPDSASTGTMWATGKKTSTGGSRRPDQRRDVPGRTCRRSSSARRSRQEDRQRVDGRDHRRHAAVLELAHLAAVPGPGRQATTARRHQGGRCLGSIAEQTVDHKVDVVLGGGRAASSRRSPAVPTPARPSSVAQQQGYTVSPTPPGSPPRRHGKVLGLFNPGNMTTEWSGPRPPRRRPPAAGCNDGNRPAERAEPGRDDDEGARPARGRPRRLLPAGRGRLDRQAGSRRQRLRPDRRDRRVRSRIGVALDYQRRTPTR